MPEKLYDFDPADMLEGEEAYEIFLADAFETGDARHIARALGAVARAKGMTKIESEAGDPMLETTLAVMKAIGFEMSGKRLAA